MRFDYRALRLAMQRSGYTIPKLAEKIGIAEKTLWNWLNGQTEPRITQAHRLSKILDFNIDSLLMDEPPGYYDQVSECRHIHVVGHAAAGGVEISGWTDGNYPPSIGFDEVCLAVRDPHSFALEVRGDSMLPRLMPGDRVIVDPALEYVPGALHFVRFADSRSYIKLVTWRDQLSTWVLENCNHAYETIYASREDLRTLWRVAFIIPK